jgi:hypothetical protein
MKTLMLAAAIAFGIVFWGCNSGKEIQQIHELRFSGKQKEARELTLSFLAESPKQKALWQELGRIDLEIFRMERLQKKDPDRSSLVEAALICGIFIQREGKKPSEGWKTLGAQIYTMVTAECTSMINIMKHQKDLAAYLNDMVTNKSDAYGSERSITVTSATVEEYRDQAGDLLKQLAVCMSLLDIIPESSEGTRDILKKQIVIPLEEWVNELELEPSQKESIWDQKTADVKKIMEAASSEIDDLGYLQVATITQSKVL